MARYNGQKEYQTTGSGGVVSSLPIYAIGKPDNFLELAQNAVNKMEANRKEVSQLEEIATKAFNEARLNVNETQHPYIDELQKNYVKEIKDNIMDPIAVREINTKYADDEGLAKRIKHNGQYVQWLNGIQNRPDVNPLEKQYYIDTHPYEYTDGEFQYKNAIPEQSIDWDKELPMLWANTIRPDKISSDSGRGSTTDGNGYKRTGHTTTQKVTVKDILDVNQDWIKNNLPRIYQSFDAEYHYLHVTLPEKLADPNLSEADRKRLQDERDLYALRLKEVDRNDINSYIKMKLETSDAIYAEQFANTIHDSGGENYTFASNENKNNDNSTNKSGYGDGGYNRGGGQGYGQTEPTNPTKQSLSATGYEIERGDVNLGK